MMPMAEAAAAQPANQAARHAAPEGHAPLEAVAPAQHLCPHPEPSHVIDAELAAEQRSSPLSVLPIGLLQAILVMAVQPHGSCGGGGDHGGGPQGYPGMPGAACAAAAAPPLAHCSAFDRSLAGPACHAGALRLSCRWLRGAFDCANTHLSLGVRGEARAAAASPPALAPPLALSPGSVALNISGVTAAFGSTAVWHGAGGMRAAGAPRTHQQRRAQDVFQHHRHERVHSAGQASPDRTGIPEAPLLLLALSSPADVASTSQRAYLPRSGAGGGAMPVAAAPCTMPVSATPCTTPVAALPCTAAAVPAATAAVSAPCPNLPTCQPANLWLALQRTSPPSERLTPRQDRLTTCLCALLRRSPALEGVSLDASLAASSVCRASLLRALAAVGGAWRGGGGVWGAALSRLSVDLIAVPGLHTSAARVRLAELECLSALRSLEDLSLCGAAEVTDVAPLASLASLTRLHVSTGRNPSLRDLQPLSRLTRLEALELPWVVAGAELAPLAGLPRLALLDLRGAAALGDGALSPLRGCGALRSLVLAWCGGKVPRLRPLVRCRALQHIDLSWCERLPDLSPLSECAELSHVDVSECSELDCLAALSDCPSLHRLDVRSSPRLASLRALLAPGRPAAAALCHLDLSRCGALSDLSPLTEAAPKLATLCLSMCGGVTDLSPLSSAASLSCLSLRGCGGVTDLSPLSGCRALAALNLSHCYSVDRIDALRAMPQLASLDLSECALVSDLSPLASCRQLSSLSLSNCGGVSDLSPLLACGRLCAVSLVGCRVLRASLRALASRPGLSIHSARSAPELTRLLQARAAGA
mmetsp:Transcript_37670/g.111442  ORF Transcript_37670/g.111442 Transcript_37670/m.111442 type:complete len:817 (-) Transcript_37670:1926-4376(-)